MGFMYLRPDSLSDILSQPLLVADLALFLLLAYILGFFLQSMGSLLESCYWKLWKGKPSDWVANGEHFILDNSQIEILQGLIKSKLKIKELISLQTENYPLEVWWPITRRIRVELETVKRTQRLELFSANISMSRSLAVTVIILLITSLYSTGLNNMVQSLTLLLAVGFSFYRLHRFGVQYSQELFLQFIALRSE